MYIGTVRRVSHQEIQFVKFAMEMEDNGRKTDLYKEFLYAGDLRQCVSCLNTNKKPLHDVLGFRKKINGITVDIALQWCVDGYSDTILGYANSVRTIAGGSHIDGMKASLIRTFNCLAKKSKVVKDNIITFGCEHVMEGLTCIVSVIVPNPEFEGQTQTRLGNPYVREVVEQSVQEYLTEFFELNPNILDRLISKFLNSYKTSSAIKRAREVIRPQSLSTTCTVLKKLTESSSKKTGGFIGRGDSSSGPAKLDRDKHFQSKRKREQPQRTCAFSIAPGKSLETASDPSFENKRQKLKSCDPSSRPRFSSQQTAGAINLPTRKDVSVKIFKDVASSSIKTRPIIPIGHGFQAEIPVRIAPTKKGKFYGSPGDSVTLRWLGTGVWPTYSLKKKAHYKNVGEGRSDSCSCASPRSTNCIKHHIKEGRERIEKELDHAFYTWKFHQMGEFGSKQWTTKEEQRFETLVQKYPLSSSEGFWEFASKDFPSKSEKDLIDYYYNVYLIKRMRLLASSSDEHIDSDDDNYDDFLVR
ncbi:unnamed protein product [Cochlearia groenlandica]